jgi:hypothetical protein
MDTYTPPLPHEILSAHYRKGVLLLEPSAEIEKVKGKLFTVLTKAFPAPHKSVDSGFVVFCSVTWPTWKVTIDRGLDTQTAAILSCLESETWFVECIQQLMRGAHIDEFMAGSAASGDCDYVLSIDFYPNRAPGKTGGYHKDSNYYTTFILLSYFNEAPVWGPEWMLDLGKPRYNVDGGGVEWRALRWYEKELPPSVKSAVTHMRRSWFNDELRVRRTKTLEDWASLARCKVLPKSANLAFFDPIITHSSPNVATSLVHHALHPSGIRQDFKGGSTERFDTLGGFARKIPRDLAHPEKSERWLNAEAETFQNGRAFLRIEVQAIPKAPTKS